MIFRRCLRVCHLWFDFIASHIFKVCHIEIVNAKISMICPFVGGSTGPWYKRLVIHKK